MSDFRYLIAAVMSLVLLGSAPAAAATVYSQTLDYDRETGSNSDGGSEILSGRFDLRPVRGADIQAMSIEMTFATETRRGVLSRTFEVWRLDVTGSGVSAGTTGPRAISVATSADNAKGLRHSLALGRLGFRLSETGIAHRSVWVEDATLSVTEQAAPVPLPGSAALLLAALGGGWALTRRRQA